MRYKRIIWLLVLLVQLATLTSQAQTSISLTDNGDGTWGLAQMPAYNVRMVVEYEDLIPKPGDVNCDGRVNIADVVAIVNYIKGETPPVFNEEKADVSGNGRVTVDDLMIIVNVIMLNK